ncbi:ATP-binding protein [Paenibacillus apiarius]|uniref:histidine kinase n=1 Tax=Paenibacillus apiarius TaxID=46240 RepID=A0ABT4E1L8_9BACL|nr:sensor histidine kinase [Paenibacillus apiarius]MCY9517928.1 sensor histidine kinase [Paenibacillus apiarius]MCY9523508.1 sensor histidine kinase [Paenibacillus apiarius]MCY9555514.1 sensor histidine kinase [Paenibacillus apiarius]MCY9561530.1 sensor histidine kinase [Paenibacillus apiarius]MCY9686723.1 sensor histidine kinase [Paenibacillus apiarius]
MKRFSNMKCNLRLKMILLISLLIIGICTIFAVFLERFIWNMTEDQTGKRALSLAHSVANIPEIKEAFQLEEPYLVIQAIVQPIQQESGAEFIVVGDTDEIRQSHPNPNIIGKKMVGSDNDRALLRGESYVSKKEGTLGLSIRGKVPISDEGKIVGVVSVGFLNNDVHRIVADQSKSLWITLSMIILFGISGAIFIASYIKRLLHNMEPEEISHLYLQKEAILQSTHEGIIAVDNHGAITAINKAAKDILFTQMAQKQMNYAGASLNEIVPSLNTDTNAKHRSRLVNREMVLGEDVVLVNQTPIVREDAFTGIVYTFRKKTELETVTEELSRIKQYANAQRAQTHEYSNKLHIILGLVQNNRTMEVIDFIKKESNIQQARLTFLSEKVADPLIQALLQGKFNQANELGISMVIHPDSRLDEPFSEGKQDALLTALGNVIENALESVNQKEDGLRKVSIFFTDMGDDCIFEIEDSGSGVAAKDIARIFEQGFSTKQGRHRGTGLALTKLMLNGVGGEILLEEGEGELGGACFMIVMPKDGRGSS